MSGLEQRSLVYFRRTFRWRGAIARDEFTSTVPHACAAERVVPWQPRDGAKTTKAISTACNALSNWTWHPSVGYQLTHHACTHLEVLRIRYDPLRVNRMRTVAVCSIDVELSCVMRANDCAMLSSSTRHLRDSQPGFCFCALIRTICRRLGAIVKLDVGDDCVVQFAAVHNNNDNSNIIIMIIIIINKPFLEPSIPRAIFKNISICPYPQPVRPPSPPNQLRNAKRLIILKFPKSISFSSLLRNHGPNQSSRTRVHHKTWPSYFRVHRRFSWNLFSCTQSIM